MIEARELRIGNLLYGEDGKPLPVAYIGETIGLANAMGGTDKYQYNPILSYDITKLSPIPLTEEWLLRFGFESDLIQIGVLYSKDRFQFYEAAEEAFGVCLNGIDVYFKYVHQLQNLYFALTGKELTPALTDK